MSKTKSITINGTKYDVAYVDDTQVGASTWSSQKIHDEIQAAKEDVNNSAAIVCESSGDVIRVNDASDRTLRGLSVYGKTTQFTTTGKNLVDISKLLTKQSTFLVDNGDGTYTATRLDSTRFSASQEFYVPAGTTLHVSCDIVDTSNPSLYMPSFMILDVDGNAMINETIVPGTGKTVTLTGDSASISLYLSTSSAVGDYVTFKNLQVEIGSSKTTYEPYTGGIPAPNPDYPQELENVGGDGDIAVTVYGKNLFFRSGNPVVENGSTIETNNDGATVQGKNGSTPGTSLWGNGWAHFDRSSEIHLKAGTVITMSCDYTVLEKHQSARNYVAIYSSGLTGGGDTTLDMATAQIGVPYRISRTFTVPNDGTYKRFTVTVHSSKVKVENLQWEIGSIATSHEPYKSKQTITIPHALPGIPVSSGGNYTDENGRQWVTDEIDLARGVYVQNVYEKVFAGTESLETYAPAVTNGVRFRLNPYTKSGFASFAFCSHFTRNGGLWGDQVSGQYKIVAPDFLVFRDDNYPTVDTFKTWLAEQYTAGTPVKVQYVLETPIETPLSAEEIAAYSALHTNKPNTTVFNDSGAGQKVAYVADTKAYIDNKFAELSAAIVNNI